MLRFSSPAREQRSGSLPASPFGARLWWVLPAVLASLVSVASAAWAGDPGVSADSILFGETAPLTGPASVLGIGMRSGLLAAFAEVNRKGGVAGRQLKLITYDDGYEPERSIAAMRRLINEDNVFAILGAVGTPSTVATEPMATGAGLPFIAALTGAEFLRNPFNPKVVNVRASYFQETETLIKRLTEDRGYSRFAILFQDDAFGRAGLAGVEAALTRRGLALVGRTAFERNTTAVKLAALSLREANPQALIMIGPYKPCAEFIKLARRLGMSTQIASISFLGSEAFANEAGADAVGTIVTQVMPSPNDVSLPIVAEYRSALREYDPTITPGYLALEGYVSGRLTIAALEKLSGEPTRAALLSAIRGASFDLGGLNLTYGDSDNRGSSQVFLTVIDPGGSTRTISDVTEPHG